MHGVFPAKRNTRLMLRVAARPTRSDASAQRLQIPLVELLQYLFFQSQIRDLPTQMSLCPIIPYRFSRFVFLYRYPGLELDWWETLAVFSAPRTAWEDRQHGSI